jgi:hypothetical protein
MLTGSVLLLLLLFVLFRCLVRSPAMLTWTMMLLPDKHAMTLATTMT